MSFAKQYLQQYNAGSAWDSLRGGTGAYDYSSMPEYANTFRTINNADVRPRNAAQDFEDMSGVVYGFRNRARQNRINSKNAQFANAYNVDSLMNSVIGGEALQSINQLPQQLMNNALAGKYVGGFPSFGIGSFF